MKTFIKRILLLFLLLSPLYAGAQVWPYLRLAGQDEHLREMLEGTVRCQLSLLCIDPYANAFNDGPAKDRIYKNTRRFVWQNTLFGELLLKIIGDDKLELLNSIEL